MLFTGKNLFKYIFSDTFSFESEGWDLNGLTLSFTGRSKEREPEFLNIYLNNSLRPFRLSLVLGIITFALFYILDLLIFPDQVKTLFIIRFAFIIPLLIAILIFTFAKNFIKYMQIVASLSMYFSSLAVILMVIMIPATAEGYMYYTGLILILFLGYSLTRIRFIYAFFTGWLILGTYETGALIIDTPARIFINNNFFFITANLLGMMISYYLEYSARKNYFLQYQLKKEREKISEAYSMLEKRVIERTKELHESNILLKKEIKRRDEYKQKQAKLEAQLFQLHKMETIGTLAGGIAHDFNNILTPILGYSGMLLDELKEGSPLKEDVEQIQKAAERGKTIVQKVLTFSRYIDTDKKPVLMNEVITETIDLVKVSLSKNISIKTDLSPECGAVMADKPQIQQVLMNIMINAIHAMKEKGGILEIKLNQEFIEKKQVNTCKKVRDGYYNVITITDTGHGMNSETLQRIFEPFYTNKEIGEGTGLGLAIVHGIVKNHSGFIEVVSKPDEGTAFRIYFPEYKNEKIKYKTDEKSFDN